MNFVRMGLIVLLALFMAFMGSQKLTGDNAVFSYIAWQSGISLFEPGVRLLTGLAEFAAALLLLGSLFISGLRGWGALLSLAVIGGALVFHLSPWLGINAPVAFSEGAVAPYTQEADYQKAPMLFAMAVGSFLVSAVLVMMDKSHLPFLKPEAEDG